MGLRLCSDLFVLKMISLNSKQIVVKERTRAVATLLEGVIVNCAVTEVN